LFVFTVNINLTTIVALVVAPVMIVVTAATLAASATFAHNSIFAPSARADRDLIFPDDTIGAVTAVHVAATIAATIITFTSGIIAVNNSNAVAFLSAFTQVACMNAFADVVATLIFR